jgi:lipoprotein LprG
MKRALPLVVSLLVLAGCSGDDEPAVYEPDDVLALAAERMSDVRSVAYTLELEGAPVYVDEDGLLEFSQAEGRYQAPDRADAVLTVRAVGIPTRVGAIQIAGDTWLTNPVTGSWEDAPEVFTFDVATLFDRTVGWRALLSEGLTNVAFAAEEEHEGETLVHLTVTAPAEQVARITAGMVRGQTVDGDLWIEPQTGEVRELFFATQTSGGTSEWTLRLTDYGLDVEIEPPDLGG